MAKKIVIALIICVVLTFPSHAEWKFGGQVTAVYIDPQEGLFSFYASNLGHGVRAVIKESVVGTLYYDRMITMAMTAFRLGTNVSFDASLSGSDWIVTTFFSEK